MGIIAEELLRESEESGMVPRRDRNGNIIAWKGPFLPHWYEGYMEAHKENQTACRIAQNAKSGLNEQAQTKEQEIQFKKDQARAAESKRRAEILFEASAKNA